jgi:hypothetical protein
MPSDDPMEPISDWPDPGEPDTSDIGWPADDHRRASSHRRRSRRSRLAPPSRRSPRSGTALVSIALAGAAAAAIVALAVQSGPTQTRLADAAQRAGAASGTSATTEPELTSNGYMFRTLDNPRDPTFNQLLGVNSSGEIAGYFGSGTAGHPNKGYLVENATTRKMTGHFISENFPGSAQTQVTGLNANGVTVGFWSGTNNANQADNANIGFYASGGKFHSVQFPTGDNSSPVVDQLLGVNDQGVAVGFYTNGQGKNRGYEYNIQTHQFTRVLPPGFTGATSLQSPSLTAAAINDFDDVAGFYTASGGVTDGFVQTPGGTFTQLAYPGASSTMALAISGTNEVVGSYTVGSGTDAVTHGFTWTTTAGFASVNDPLGRNSTTINGVNVRGELVGFYTDSSGSTDGFLATQVAGGMASSTASPDSAPSATQSATPEPSAMPSGSSAGSLSGTVTLGSQAGGQPAVAVSASGLTPGSAHAVEIVTAKGEVVVTVAPGLTADSAGQATVTVSSPFLELVRRVPAGLKIVILAGGPGTSPIAQATSSVATNGTSGQQSFPLTAAES